MKDSEILHSKLGDIKKKILSSNDTLAKFQEVAKTRFVVEKRELSYTGAGKEDLVTLRLPMGKYIMTMSGLMTTNASNYMEHVCNFFILDTSTPTEAQNTPFAYYSRAIIDVSADE
jgi:hypothetical protein